MEFLYHVNQSGFRIPRKALTAIRSQTCFCLSKSPSQPVLMFPKIFKS